MQPPYDIAAPTKTSRIGDSWQAQEKTMDLEALERLVMQLFGIAQRSTDLTVQRHLMKVANELVDLIERHKPSNKGPL
jgi:hypothetical protein